MIYLIFIRWELAAGLSKYDRIFVDGIRPNIIKAIRPAHAHIQPTQLRIFEIVIILHLHKTANEFVVVGRQKKSSFRILYQFINKYR